LCLHLFEQFRVQLLNGVEPCSQCIDLGELILLRLDVIQELFLNLSEEFL